MYVFFFERAAPNAGDRGAHHGAEVVYAFNNVSLSRRPFVEADRGLSDTLSSYLVEFARGGDPNVGRLPSWPAYGAEREIVLAFGDGNEARVVPQKAALDFFESFFGGSIATR